MAVRIPAPWDYPQIKLEQNKQIVKLLVEDEGSFYNNLIPVNHWSI